MANLYLTFDDKYVGLWHEYSKPLAKIGVNATFFISGILTLEFSEVDRLLEIQAMGHEIGCHSLYHLHPHKFLEVFTIQDYMQYEVIPALRQMKAYGFKVDSWAYPYNAYTPNLVKEISNYFKVQRSRSTGFLWENPCEFEDRFALLKAVSLDTHSKGNPIKSTDDIIRIIASLKAAAQEDKPIALYGHAIGKHESLSHSVDPEILVEIINIAKQCGLKFATTREAA